MNEEGLSILKEALQIPGLLKEIYGDLVKPGVSQVGKALSTVIGLGNTILWPVALLNERARIALEKNLENYRAQIEKVPLEKIIEVPPEIGVPVAEKLTYVTDEHLCDLYATLLAKASTMESAHAAHPSFVNIINNLSPDEAILLQYVNIDIPFIEASIQKNIPMPSGSSAPVYKIGRLLTDLDTKAKLSYPQNISIYLNNLKGLGIIDIKYGLRFNIPFPHENLERLYRPRLEASLSPGDKLILDPGLIGPTPFGSLFITTCTKTPSMSVI